MAHRVDVFDSPAHATHQSPRVLSVGQCGFDHRNLSGFFRRFFGAETVAVDSAAAAVEALRGGPFELVLVNRILDLDGGSGIALVRQLKARDEPEIAGTPVMLVSNYEDARRQAEALGALPGFGKADLYGSNTELIDRLRSVLGRPDRDRGPGISAPG